MKFHLPARQPFNFLSVLNSHGWIQLAPCRFENESLYYVDHLSSGRVVEYQISDAKEGVQVQTQSLNKSEQREAKEKIAWMFGLDMDFSSFYKAVHREPKLRHAGKLARGRVLRSPTLFEDVLKAILTTNRLWGATKRMALNLLASFGDPLADTDKRWASSMPRSVSSTRRAPPSRLCWRGTPNTRWVSTIWAL